MAVRVHWISTHLLLENGDVTPWIFIQTSLNWVYRNMAGYPNHSFRTHTNSLKWSEVIKHPPVVGMEHHAVSGPSGQNGPCQGWAARGSRHGDRKAWEAMSQNWSLTLLRGTCKHQQYPLVLKHGWGNTEIYSWANHLQMEKSQASHVSLPAVGKWLISIYHHESYPKYSYANIWFINGFETTYWDAHPWTICSSGKKKERRCPNPPKIHPEPPDLKNLRNAFKALLSSTKCWENMRKEH